jgi:dUTP pyrophosphatase
MTLVRIKRLSPSVSLPRYESDGAAAFDLAAAAEMTVEPGRVALVPTGLVIEVPTGMFLAIFARSSTPLKRGLMVANGVGIVDEDYCGPDDEVKIAVLNFTASAVRVAAGDRLAQGMLLPVNRVTWQDIDVLRKESRGGFGSTG